MQKCIYVTMIWFKLKELHIVLLMNEIVKISVSTLIDILVCKINVQFIINGFIIIDMPCPNYKLIIILTEIAT